MNRTVLILLYNRRVKVHFSIFILCIAMMWLYIFMNLCSDAMAADAGMTSPGHIPGRSYAPEEMPQRSDGWRVDSSPQNLYENTPGLNTILIPLIRYWMPSFGPGGDHMTSFRGAEEDLPKGTVNQGILYYIQSDPAADTLPLFRLLSTSSDMDHMDSNTADVSGYLPEAFLGYPSISANDGMLPINRLLNPETVDHMTAFFGETLDGYADDGMLGYGYPRFGENDGPGKKHYPVSLQFAYNGVAVNADLSRGGVIYELWWNGKQFVNNNDCGREIQTALFKPGLADTQFGPTEAGDRMYFGSPIADVRAIKMGLYTRSLPLQWDPTSYGGGPDNPVLYGGEFDRRAFFLLLRSRRIIRYTVGYKPAESANYLREWVTAYLNLGVSDRFFVDTAQEGTVEIAMPPNNQYVTRPIEEGAVLTASADLNYAIGFYTPSPAFFSWYNFEGQESDSEKTRKINLWDTDAAMEAGTWYRRTVYLLVGTLSDVRDDIAYLRHRFQSGSSSAGQDILRENR